MAQRFDANGIEVGGEFVVNTLAANDQVDPTVTALADGGFLVAWSFYNPVEPDVYARRFDANGNAVDAVEFRVNSTTTSYQHIAPTAGLTGGGFVVLYHSNQNDSGDIYAHLYDATGASVSDAAARVLEDVEPRDDVLASAWYRSRVLPSLVARALADLGNAGNR